MSIIVMVRITPTSPGTMNRHGTHELGRGAERLAIQARHAQRAGCAPDGEGL
jgi:hypothetical protein